MAKKSKNIKIESTHNTESEIIEQDGSDIVNHTENEHIPQNDTLLEPTVIAESHYIRKLRRL